MFLVAAYGYRRPTSCCNLHSQSWQCCQRESHAVHSKWYIGTPLYICFWKCHQLWCILLQCNKRCVLSSYHILSYSLLLQNSFILLIPLTRKKIVQISGQFIHWWNTPKLHYLINQEQQTDTDILIILNPTNCCIQSESIARKRKKKKQSVPKFQRRKRS